MKLPAIAHTALLTSRITRDRFFWAKRPRSELRSAGYEVIPGFLSEPECDRLVGVANTHLRETSYAINSSAYLVVRADATSGRDRGVRQIMNAQCVDERLMQIFRTGTIERLVEDRLGVPVTLESITLQVDDPDTASKRCFHVDRFSPPTFKLFVYLTDVGGPQHGPYTVVPGSHRDVVRKVRSAWLNLRAGAPFTDVGFAYSDRDARLITARRGTAILSCQALAHKGWHEHTERRRYMLVAYLALSRYASDGPFALGRDMIPARPA